METRISILLTFFYHFFTIVLVGGCTQIPYPDINAIPASSKLPIDGIWKALPIQDAYDEVIFKVDRGRMSLYGAKNVTVSNMRWSTVLNGCYKRYSTNK